jgi:hypothetical protein
MITVARHTKTLWSALFLIGIGFVSRAAFANYDGGTGEPNNPYLIDTAEHLNAIGAEPNDWDKHFKLMADIDLSAIGGTRFNTIGHWRAPTDFRAFTGTFDGGGRQILNFRYSSQAEDATGLFACLSGADAEIRNLTLVDPNIQARSAERVGSLVGYLRDATVRRCHVRGGSVTERIGVGGLVGNCEKGRIIASSAVCDVRGADGGGGLLGFCAGGIVSQCASGGSVGGIPGYRGWEHVGGLVGCIDVFLPADIICCYSRADVKGNVSVGGLVGDLRRGRITNCYASGEVSGVRNLPFMPTVGGLVGAYSANAIRGGPSVSNSFWDVNATGQMNSAGRAPRSRDMGGTAKDTAAMQTASTFLEVGWDFEGETENGTDDVWWILEGQDYPRLWWERGDESPH